MAAAGRPPASGRGGGEGWARGASGWCISVSSLGICLFVVLTELLGCSSQTCVKAVETEAEARQSIAIFFTTDTSASRRLIARLREDGMEDRYLAILQNGCSECYVHRGYRQWEGKGWYAVASIAAPEAKKEIVLEVDRDKAVWLDHTLYGG